MASRTGGSHPPGLGVRLGLGQDGSVGPVHGALQGRVGMLDHRRPGPDQFLLDHLGGDPSRQIAGCGTAHPVADQQQYPLPRERDLLPGCTGC